ncbi:MAG: helix-turn-helix transcriptional regulator [Chloroflexi bacterium]|nr:helix-turn-helix transcriptional regulator [Chloroflexota bacterium]
MEDGFREESVGLGAALEALRRRKRFSLNALAEGSGVSRTYITQIESGVDSRTGKKIEPSPGILKKLADTLADGDAAEAGRIYQELMARAGYLPAETAKQPPSALEDGGRFAARRLSESLPPAAAAYSAGSPVLLSDARLLAHGRAVLDHWDELTPGEQAAVLEFLEFIDEKRRRRRGGFGRE